VRKLSSTTLPTLPAAPVIRTFPVSVITDSPFIDLYDASPLYGCVIATEVVHTGSILQFFSEVRSGIRLKLRKDRSQQLTLRASAPFVLDAQLALPRLHGLFAFKPQRLLSV
jgi:hypothetical protein